LGQLDLVAPGNPERRLDPQHPLLQLPLAVLFVLLDLPDLLPPVDQYLQLDLAALGNPEGQLDLVGQDCLVDPEGLVRKCPCRVGH